MNVRTLCLGLLAFKEASGYEIKKAVEEGMFSHFIDASYGSIYPALTQMLADGLVNVREEAQHGKPLKKVYSITEAGRTSLRKSLHEQPQKDKFKSEFLFQTLFRDDLEQEHLQSIYDGYIEYLHSEIAIVDECGAGQELTPGQAFVNDYARTMLTTALHFIENAKPKLGLPDMPINKDAAE